MQLSRMISFLSGSWAAVEIACLVKVDLLERSYTGGAIDYGMDMKWLL
jgi:hypothetical protein